MEHHHHTPNGNSNNNCGWCSENKTELQTLLKEIQELTARITESRQDMDCCTCKQSESKVNDSNNVSVSAVCATSNMNLLHTPTMQIKKEEAEEPKLQPDQDLKFMYKCMTQFNCLASFPTLPAMLSHLATAHSWNTAGHTPYCNICGQLFLTNLAREKHKKVAHGLHCGLCNGNFFNEAHYAKHMREVHKYYNYSGGASSCLECGQAGFEDKRALVSHMLSIHGTNTGSGSQERQLLWKCEACLEGKKNPKPKYFTSEEEFMEHQLRKHRQECRVCGRIFTTFKSMNCHCVAEHGVDNGNLGGQGQGQRQGQGMSKGKLRKLKRQEREAYKCKNKKRKR